MLARRLAPLLVLTAWHCDRSASLREPPATHPDPVASAAPPIASAPAPVASTLAPTPVPPGLDASTATPGVLPPDPEALARAVGARFHRPTPVRVEPDGFTLVGIGSTPVFEHADRLIHRALTAYFHGRFATPPAHPVSILFFSSRADYDTWCEARYGLSGTDYFGFYHRGRQELVVDGSGGEAYLPTLTHEIVHPIVETDFPDAPRWLDEGLGTLFEAPTFGAAGEIHGAAVNRRYPRLHDALASPADAPTTRLDALFGMTDAAFEGDDPEGDPAHREDRRLLHFAMARSRDGSASDPTGERAFTAVVGKTPAQKGQSKPRWGRGARRPKICSTTRTWSGRSAPCWWPAASSRRSSPRGSPKCKRER